MQCLHPKKSQELEPDAMMSEIRPKYIMNIYNILYTVHTYIYIYIIKIENIYICAECMILRILLRHNL